MHRMIQYADATVRPQVRRMWKDVFGDTDAFLDLYFRDKYRDDRTLVYIEEGAVVASLQLLPYDFSFCGTEIPAAYYSGVCTLPEARGKGYMSALMKASLFELQRKNIALALLVPAEQELTSFYGSFGFSTTFDAGNIDLPSLKELSGRWPGDLFGAYREFDSWFRANDMTVQKSFDDFRVIMEDSRLFDFPAARSLPGMARVIDAGSLLRIFEKAYPDISIALSITDSLLERNCIEFAAGKCRDVPYPVDIAGLAQLLLGYHTSEKAEPLRAAFPEKTPQMHFMLE
ncbi:MAG TPA: GNAT family N-acetyltransferase [Porphyromonadaceae bacterium]|nr:GNAT family N-acetyltransferase [Porphyromonadaceae bacterium]